MALPNKGMKLTKPGQLRSFAAYPRCSADADVAGLDGRAENGVCRSGGNHAEQQQQG